MFARLMATGIAALALTACQTGVIPAPPATADLSKTVRAAQPGKEAPEGKAGECWATDTMPAVIETTSDQVETQAAVKDASGKVIRPATFATSTSQRIVRDRKTVHFRAPCAGDLTPDLIASLQRALKARGYYLSPVNGRMDAATRDAIRRFQAPLGLDSPTLSLAGARSLGLVATEMDTL